MEINSIVENFNYQVNKFTKESFFAKNSKESNRDDINFNKIWSAIDSYFDLGDPNKSIWMQLSPVEQSHYWRIIAKLIQKGVVGYRYYEVNGQIEKHFIEYEMANPRFANAKVKYYSKKQYTREWVV